MGRKYKTEHQAGVRSNATREGEERRGCDGVWSCERAMEDAVVAVR